MRILITGGAGYVGSRLVPALLEDGHTVMVFDTFWFGDHLPPDAGQAGPHVFPWLPGMLFKERGDVRDVALLRKWLCYSDAVIHLACLSNDPSSEIDADLTRAINLDAFEPLVVAAKEAGVRRFIYCSTSSVYGVSDAPEVREDHPHKPITLYNTYKSQCEPLLMRHASPDFECVVLRPATVCGYSPRQRLDLVVNVLTNQAYNAGKITVYGGAQMRPSVHIDDLVDCYRHLLTAPAHLVAGEIFNFGAGNKSVEDLALLVQAVVYASAGKKSEIEFLPTQDPRSYRVNNDKISSVLGFHARRTVQDAVADLCAAFAAGRIPDSMGRSEYYNVRRMKEVLG